MFPFQGAQTLSFAMVIAGSISRKRHVEGPGQLADGGGAPAQAFKHQAARGIGEGAEYGIDGFY